MQEKKCNWCEKEIVKSDELAVLKETLLIPICEPTFTEQQVIDGECCLSCYELNTGLGQIQRDWLYPPYCLKCTSPIYSSYAFNLKSINQLFEKGQLSALDRDLMIAKEEENLAGQRLRAKDLKAQLIAGREMSIYHQAFANECLCDHCLWKEMKKSYSKVVPIRHQVESWEYADSAQARKIG